MYDQLSGVFLLVLVSAVTVAYLIRVALRGGASFERVERQGGSAYLGKALKAMGYWAMLPLGKFVHRLGVSANQLSWASVFLGVVSAAFLARGRFGFASLFSVAAVMCDALDGMVARMAGKSTTAGEVLDSVLDRYVDFFFLAGLAMYYRAYPALQMLCLLTILGSFMVSYSTAKAEAVGASVPSGGMRRPERMVYLLFGAVLSSLTIPFEPIDAGGVALGIPMVIALFIVGIGSNVTAGLRFVATARSASDQNG